MTWIMVIVGGIVGGAIGGMLFAVLTILFWQIGEGEEGFGSNDQCDCKSRPGSRCPITPPGWEQCTREFNHPGPCAHERRPDGEQMPS